MSHTLTQPIPPTLLIRILVLIILVLSYLAGYYHSAWRAESDKNAQLEMITEETQ